MAGLSQDLRYAVRLLRRTPRNSAIALTILALGIGANTAIFSAVNHVLLRPLPFPEADRLIRVRDAVVSADGQLHPFNMYARDIIALRETGDMFDGIVGFGGTNMTLTGGDAPLRLSVVLQTAGNDVTLKMRPAVGRGFTPDEQRRGMDSGVAILSDSLWKTRFGGSPSALTTTIRLDDRVFTVIGVMPPLYAFPYDAQIWIPTALDPSDRVQDFAVWGHMRPGVTLEQVRTGLRPVAAHIMRAYPDTLQSFSFEAMTLQENLTGSQTSTLRALTLIVAFLLLTACVNVATLLLARSVTRRREFAVRAALGATRDRHLRQLLAESLVLAALGCGAGLLVTEWLSAVTANLIPSVLSEQLGLATLRTDWHVAAFAVAVSLASAVVAAVVPAFGSWSASPRAALSDGGRAMTGRHGGRLLGALIVAETALTLVLLAGAGLMIQNFLRLRSLPLGFDARGLLTLELMPSATAYPPGAARDALIRRVVDEARSLPGVSAGITTVNPLGGGTWSASVISEDTSARDPSAVFNVNYRLITPGLLEAMGIPVVRGRTFTDQDRAGSQPVAIVSAQMAHRFWPDRDAVGQRMRIARAGAPWVTIVGVAGNVSDSHDPGVPLETWYLPFAQQAGSSAAAHVYLMARAGGSALALVSPIEQAIWRVDKTLAPYGVTLMDRYYAESIRRERLGAGFMLGFAAFGLVLAALGVYGVMAFSVAQRTAEIGIRIALGGTRRDILPLVLGRGVRLIVGGIGIGLASAAVLNRVLSSVLAEVGALDAPVLAVSATLILVAGVAASVLPAMRAARLDPLVALRAD
jgi:putative ABC transport system permease protein